MIIIFCWIINILLVILSVAFFTLFERKIISLVHLRLGPNKVSMLGLLQPILDAAKLLTKQQIQSITANKVINTSAPIVNLSVSVLFWILIPHFYFVYSCSYSILIYLVLGSLIVLIGLLAGWRRNRKYRFIGRLRSIAQSISYEAVFTTLIILVAVVTQSYSIATISKSISIIGLVLIPIWLFCLLAETHRAPFDFSESESELVRGYNTEYRGGGFAWLFLSEYSALLFGSSVIYIIFVSNGNQFISHPVILSIGILSIVYIITLVRVSICRFRYDYLIKLAWKGLLPIALSILVIRFVF